MVTTMIDSGDSVGKTEMLALIEAFSCLVGVLFWLDFASVRAVVSDLMGKLFICNEF